LFPVWRDPESVWERAGLTRRQQRRLNLALVATTLLLLAGWVYATVDVVRSGALPSIARRVAATPNLLARDAPAPATFLLEAALDRFTCWEKRFGGVSGGVRIVVQEAGDSLLLPDSVPAGVRVEYLSVEQRDSITSSTPGSSSPSAPGIWNILLRMREAVQTVPGMSIVTLVPASEVRDGRLGSY